MFSFWSVLRLLLGNNKNEVFSFIFGPMAGETSSRPTIAGFEIL
jgi:hypothetical protein